MVTKGDLTLGVGHTIQYTDDVLLNYTLETYIIILTNITPGTFNLKIKTTKKREQMYFLILSEK